MLGAFSDLIGTGKAAVYGNDPMEIIDDNEPSVITEALEIAGQPPMLVSSLAETNSQIDRMMRAWLKVNSPLVHDNLTDAELEFDANKFYPAHAPKYRDALEKYGAARSAAKREWMTRMNPQLFQTVCRVMIQKYENAPPDASLDAPGKAQTWRRAMQGNDRESAIRLLT